MNIAKKVFIMLNCQLSTLNSQLERYLNLCLEPVVIL